MKKYLPIFFLFSFFILLPFVHPVFAQTSTTQASTSATLPDGTWIKDPEVTNAGKNASRSGMMLDWTLRDYQWSSVQPGQTNPLIPFWLVIQHIVYALFLFVVIVTAFILIVTRGQSLSAKRFLPRFLFVVLLVTFSFSFIQFLYQIVDIFEGFFLKNPQGAIISSHDLLYIGFDYRNFQGLRLFGPSFQESAFTSLLLVKLTSFTYYVMAMLLIVRKIILWFFIVLSPVFPLLLLFYPVRNTAKIWIGEFFRWLLYAPLFAIFLSGLVKLWQTNLPLLFNFSGVSSSKNIIYPTAINILLGGPKQPVSITNSVNVPDTFVLYVVALIMLWVVIILPFILLQIFLDYMMSFNYANNPLLKQMIGLMSTRMAPPSNPVAPVPVGPPPGSGLARNFRFGKTLNMPRDTGEAKPIATGQTISQAHTVQPSHMSQQRFITNLTQMSIPTMRDIARAQITSLTNNTTQQTEVTRMRQTLQQLANPQTATSRVEREKYQSLRERLVTEGQKGNTTATTILTAANTYNTYHSYVSSTAQTIQHVLSQIANPEQVASTVEREKIVKLKEQLVKESKEGSQLAASVLTNMASVANNQVQRIQELVTKLANPQSLSDVTDRQTYQQLREKVVAASRSGNALASLLVQSLDKAQSPQQVQKLQQELLSAQGNGSPLASELMKTVQKTEVLDQKQIQKIQKQLQAASKAGDSLAEVLLQLLAREKEAHAPVSADAKLKNSGFPAVNRVQQVSLDDYEAVKKLWTESYQNMDVPESTAGNQTRKEWIQSDTSDIEQTISLLTSSNPADVEEGMKHVSDILPFLLVGGFSQSEIVAYLKAKMEAGKTVLETLKSDNTDEDVLVDAKRTSTAASDHLTVTAQAVPAESQTVINNTTNTYTYNTQQTNNEQHITQAPPASQVLQSLNLTLPTMKDIVRYEHLLQSGDSAQKQEVEKMKQTVLQLSHVDELPPSEKDKFVRIRQQLEKESKEGNQLATVLLKASELMQKEKTDIADSSIVIIETLRNILDPSRIEDTEMRKEFNTVRSELTEAKHKSDPFALSLISVVDEVTKAETEQTRDFLTRLSTPEKISTATERIQITKLRERLEQEKEEGNELASSLLQAAKPEVDSIEANKVRIKLSEAVLQHDAIASYIVSSLLTLPKDVQTLMTSVTQQLLQQKDTDNPLAKAILRLIKQQNQQRAVGGATVMSLPKQNRVQQVSLDDYEAVKNLWKENYAKAEPPVDTAGKVQSRENWIRTDITNVQQAMNLLLSSNQPDVEEGMEMIGDILPFLLVGGFSQSEIVAYLKAKLEAAQETAAELERTSDESQTTAAHHETIQAVHEQAMSLPEREQDQTAAVTAPVPVVPSQQRASTSAVVPVTGAAGSAPQIYQQINLQLPTLKDVAAFESNTKSLRELQHDQMQRLETTLKELAAPAAIPSVEKQKQYTLIKETLDRESKTGDTLAALLLAAAKLAKEPKGHALPVSVHLPKQNRLQRVSLDDYEEVKKIWYENYLHAPVPPDKDGKEQSRIAWIQTDMQDITRTINLISSENEAERAEGLGQVGDILPFLLVGGFSQAEIIGYLKAKLEAGKMALTTLNAGAEDVELQKSSSYNNPEQKKAQEIDDTKEEETHDAR